MFFIPLRCSAGLECEERPVQPFLPPGPLARWAFSLLWDHCLDCLVVCEILRQAHLLPKTTFTTFRVTFFFSKSSPPRVYALLKLVRLHQKSRKDQLKKNKYKVQLLSTELFLFLFFFLQSITYCLLKKKYEKPTSNRDEVNGNKLNGGTS